MKNDTEYAWKTHIIVGVIYIITMNAKHLYKTSYYLGGRIASKFIFHGKLLEIWWNEHDKFN